MNILRPASRCTRTPPAFTAAPARAPFLFRFTALSRSELGSRSQLGPGAVAVGRPVPERTRTQVSGETAARVRVGGEAGGSGQGPGVHACSCWAGGAELSRRGRRRATDSEGPRRLRRAGIEGRQDDHGLGGLWRTAKARDRTGPGGPRHLQP